MAQYFFKTPFANTGDVTTIPRATQVDGSVSFEKGFPVDYQLDPDSEPTAKDVPRNQFNELMKYITGALQILQIHGFPDFVTTADNDGTPNLYDANATVRFAGGWAGAAAMNYYSLEDANDTTPADATKWGLVTYQKYELPGVCKEFFGASLPTGYVWANGQTIGDASSNATGRANADTLDLFTVLWGSYSNTVLPILTSGGVASTRGVSAVADFGAHKQLPVPDKRENVSVGLGNMGGTSDPGRITLASAGFNPTTLGASGGVESVALTSGQNAAHTHSGTTDTDGAHTHTAEGCNGQAASGSYTDYYTGTAQNGLNVPGNPGSGFATSVSSNQCMMGAQTNAFPLRAKSSGSAHAHAFTTSSSGSGTAHTNVQPTLVSNFIIALGTA